MNISFEEIGRLTVTFAAGESLKADQVCKLGTDGKAVACADNDSFCGIAEQIRKGYAAVQVAGFVRVGYSGSAPEVGYVNLCADGTGAVKTGGSREYLVVGVDESTKTVMFML